MNGILIAIVLGVGANLAGWALSQVGTKSQEIYTCFVYAILVGALCSVAF